MSHISKPLSPEEIVALALNEQGYLFQHKVIDSLLAIKRTSKSQHDWRIEAAEVPVSLPNGNETRVDAVLRRGGGEGDFWRVIVECKRAARDYKRWVFFGQSFYERGPSPRSFYVERGDLKGSWDGQGEPPMHHGVEHVPMRAQCPIFDFGVEARLNPPEKRDKASATQAIEDAFQQVTLAQVGLALKLRSTCVLYFRLIPIVITTAEILSADINLNRVSLSDGKIDPKYLKLEPQKWLGVNYRINDVVSEFSRMTNLPRLSLADLVAARQVRTVFVVEAIHVEEFLIWLNQAFPNP